ncbi:MAG: SPOR domain-containing protein [Pseudomonadota bacterium]
MRAMPRDYARSSRKSTSRSSSRRSAPAKQSPARQRKPKPRKSSGKGRQADVRGIWSAPSFSAGVIFGAVLVLLASYAPVAFEETVEAVRDPVVEPDQVTFEYDDNYEYEDLLEEREVVTNPGAYPAEFPDEDPNGPQPRYEIQATSLRSEGKARSVSRELVAMGLNARYERVELGTGVWYRVTVGPFSSRREADRVMNRLREKNLTPRLDKLV